MGQSSSKRNSKEKTPELPKTESWSTLKGFVAAETAAETAADESSNVISDNMVVNDRKIERVKTWMKFPERQPKSSFDLDVHLNQSIHRSQTLANLREDIQQSSGIDAILEEDNKALPLKYKLNKHMSRSRLLPQSTPTPSPRPGQISRQPTRVLVEAQTPETEAASVCQRQMSQEQKIIKRPSRLNLERTPTQLKHLDTPSSRLPMTMDAARNLRQEPTDQEIKRQIQRWKTEFALENNLPHGPTNPPPRRHMQPKHSKSFYELRKAMVNRENVCLEQSRFVVQSISENDELESKTSQRSKHIGDVEQSLITQKKSFDFKIYDGTRKFEFSINKELPPGFKNFTEVSNAECKIIIDKIKVKETEIEFRREINELLELWKMSGFLKNIEEYVLAYPAKKTNSINEISQHIASQDANYLQSVRNVQLHMQIAKAYAIYCWIANNITDYVSSAEEHEDADFIATSDDYSGLFKTIAYHASLEAEVIEGQVRTWSNMSINVTPHSWNMVKIDNVCLLLDCTFGSGCHSSVDAEYTPDYFAVSPQHLIFTHWPENSAHQLLESFVPLEDMELILPLPITTRKEGIVPLTWSKDLMVPTEFPVVSVEVCVGNESAKLSASLVPSPSIYLPNDMFEQNIFVKNEGQKWNVQAAVPLKALYSLNIYSKSLNKPEKLCLSYMVHCDTESELKLGYPKLSESALARYGFNLIHWNSPAQSHVCHNLSGLFNMVFEAKPNVDFDQYILPGRIPNPDSHAEESKRRYNTLLLSNSGTNLSLYQLQAVFPSNGWWTVSIYGADCVNKEQRSWKYTLLLNYYVYVTVGLPKRSYPRILSPHISFEGINPLTTTGEDQFTLPFASSKYFLCSHYLIFDEKTEEPLKGYTKVDFCGKERDKESFIYELNVIFPWPGNWCVHVSGREMNENKDASLFQLKMAVNGAVRNTSFVDYNSPKAESLGVRILNDGLLTFIDDGQPLTYNFEASSSVIMHHALVSQQEDEASSHDYCTFLSSKLSDDKSHSLHTVHSVFPYAGKWSVQLFGASKNSSNYNLVITLNMNVANPSSQLCYPKISPAFSQLNMNIDANEALVKRNCENGEFQLPFTAPADNFFTWSMELLSTGEKPLSNAFVHCSPSDSLSRTFHVIFPKPGEWMIRLFSKQMTDTSTKSGSYRSAIELRLNSLSSKNGIGFPQLFEPFYSTYNLQLHKKNLPLVSHIQEIPTKVIIPIYSPQNDVQFWHELDVKSEGETDETFSQEDQCKMISDTDTGQHKLIVDVNSRGKWVIMLYVRKSDSVDKSWTTVLKHSISST